MFVDLWLMPDGRSEAADAQPNIPGAMPGLIQTAGDANANANAGPVLAALPASLGSLYTRMQRTADTVAPVAFLNLLREVRL